MNDKSKVFGALLVEYIYNTYEDYHMLTDIVEYAISNNDEKLINYLIAFVEQDNFDINILDNYLIEIVGVTPSVEDIETAEKNLKEKQDLEKNRTASWLAVRKGIKSKIEKPYTPPEPGPIRKTLDKFGMKTVKNVIGSGLSSIGNKLNQYEGVNKAYNYSRKKTGSLVGLIGKGIKKFGGKQLQKGKKTALAGEEIKPLDYANKGTEKIRYGMHLIKKSKDMAKPISKTVQKTP